MGDEDDAAGPMWDSETPAGCWWARNKMVRGLYLAASTVAFDFVFVVPDTTFVGVATLVDTVKAVRGSRRKRKGRGTEEWSRRCKSRGCSASRTKSTSAC